ncbi:MAG TPA: CHC2 zinc finger domain-containing protein, partial [Candidatus Saccharimonadales bacterium]|nr:CHC2 zinc finger domain-containing protein [Candidatus Saccharimonadales bacterium]
MDQVDEIKSKVDIVEVISSYIPLKRAGRNFSGLCPFHGEKTPSFMVSPERQAFKCFGCAEGGDVFTFLEKIEGWDFRETLEELAKRAGVKLVDFKPSGASRDKEKLIEINKLAAKFYNYILTGHKLGEPGRAYLKGRGINEDLWEKFGLGYAPNSWENVSKFLAKKGYSMPDISTAGLSVSRQTR